MAPIEPDEVAPGLVVFIDPKMSAADEHVTCTKDPPTERSGPFVCVSVDGNTSEWMPLTTEPRRERLPIRSEWRSGGHPQWLRAGQYLNDGANVWRGPTTAFINASYEELTDRETRARVLDAGLAAIQRETASQRRRRDRP